jgi:hypothetical protein
MIEFGRRQRNRRGEPLVRDPGPQPTGAAAVRQACLAEQLSLKVLEGDPCLSPEAFQACVDGLLDLWREEFWGRSVRTPRRREVRTYAEAQAAIDAILRALDEAEEVGGELEPAAPPPPPPERPRWDRRCQQLWLGDEPVRTFLRHAPAQFLILDAFEKAQWKTSVPNPCSRFSLKDAVDQLNKGLASSRLRFLRGDNNTLVKWHLTPV